MRTDHRRDSFPHVHHPLQPSHRKVRRRHRVSDDEDSLVSLSENVLQVTLIISYLQHEAEGSKSVESKKDPGYVISRYIIFIHLKSNPLHILIVLSAQERKLM